MSNNYIVMQIYPFFVILQIFFINFKPKRC